MPALHSFRLLAVALPLLSLGACSSGTSDDAPSDDGDNGASTDTLDGLDCAIPLTLSGAIELEIPREALGCAFPSNGDVDASLMFVPNGGQLSSLMLDIEGVTMGETGDFTGTLTLQFGNGRTFRATGCTVTVAGQEAGVSDTLGQRYVLRGWASCPTATNDETSETIEVSDFPFAGGTLWPPSEE